MSERTNEEWLRDLSPGPAYDKAVQDLREYLLRAVLVYLTRHRSDLAGLDYEELRQLAEDWAQSALLQVLDKLDSFRGDSRFTTWAYRVAINQAAADLRRKRWDNLSLEGSTLGRTASAEVAGAAADVSPELAATRAAIWDTVRRVIDEELTERQRTALMRAVVDGVPMEVVAEELGTNRNNVYKIIHDARKKLRKELESRDWSADDVLGAFVERRAE